MVPLDTQKSFCLQTESLLTEAEVQAGALCDWGGGAGAGYSTGGDTAVFKENRENTVNHLESPRTDHLSGTNPIPDRRIHVVTCTMRTHSTPNYLLLSVRHVEDRK